VALALKVLMASPGSFQESENDKRVILLENGVWGDGGSCEPAVAQSLARLVCLMCKPQVAHMRGLWADLRCGKAGNTGKWVCVSWEPAVARRWLEG